MKKIAALVVLLVAAGFAFAQDTVVPTTEDEAIALITQQATQLRLSARDTAAATDALKAMIQSRIQVQNAWRLVAEGLEKGLKAQEMTRLAEQVRLRTRQGLSAEECETEARLMVQTQTRTQTMTQTAAQTGEAAGAQGEAAAPAGKGK